MGKAVFLFILRDRYLQERLHSTGYNGLVNFFVSSQLLNSDDVYTDLKDIDFTACSLSTLILLFDRIFREIATSPSYESCASRVDELVSRLSLSSPEEICILFNYVACVQSMCIGIHVELLLQSIVERIFAQACKTHATSIVGFLLPRHR